MKLMAIKCRTTTSRTYTWTDSGNAGTTAGTAAGNDWTADARTADDGTDDEPGMALLQQQMNEREVNKIVQKKIKNHNHL